MLTGFANSAAGWTVIFGKLPAGIDSLAAFAIAYGANVAMLRGAKAPLGARNPFAQVPVIAAFVPIFLHLPQFFVFRSAVPE